MRRAIERLLVRAGCEPYALSTILAELDPAGRHTIIATDIDALALGRARSGTGYQPSEVGAVPPRAGRNLPVDARLKSRIHFQHHDLLKDRILPRLT